VTTTTEYRLFGILIWSVTHATSAADEEAVYLRLSARFAEEMNGALARAGRPAP